MAQPQTSCVNPAHPFKKKCEKCFKIPLFSWLPSSPSYLPSLFFHSVLSYSTLPLLLLPLHLFSNKWPSLSRPRPSPRTHPIQGAKVPEMRLFTFPMQSKEPLTRRIRCPWRDAVTARHSYLRKWPSASRNLRFNQAWGLREFPGTQTRAQQ